MFGSILATDRRQILLQGLSSIPTLTLLRRRLVNHHFRDLIERIIRKRLLVTIALNNWRLIIECYHPSRSQTEQYFFCDYQGTPGLDQLLDEKGENRLMSLLSYFKPTKETPERSFVRPHPAGDIPGSRTMDQTPRPKRTVADPVRRDINLESHENFSQLMFDASLVKLGPKKGVFDAVAEILDRRPIRIFRDWLSEQAKVTESKDSRSNAQKPGAQLLWVDESTKRAGLDVEVREKRWRSAMPILISRDEDQALSYSMDLQGQSHRKSSCMLV